MDRIGRCFAATACSLIALLIAGCEPQSGQSFRPTPFTPPKGDVPSQALQIVLDGLADPDPQVRANSIEVVATTRCVRLMPRVQGLLHDPAVPVRFLAILAVGDLQYSLARNDITQLLEDPDPNIKIAAAYAMTKLGHPEYYKVFRNAVTSDDQTVRANATLLLGKNGQRDAIPALYWALQGSDSADKVVTQAAESIAMLHDERIYPKLWTQLISVYADDRILGIRAMGELGTEQAKNAILTMLDDTVLEVRLAAAEQLGRLGEPVGQAKVAEVFEKDLLAGMDMEGQQRVKVLSALAIGEIGSESLAKHLPRLLKDSSKPVRLAAAKAVLRHMAF
jgi:HEAT repeat protein